MHDRSGSVVPEERGSSTPALIPRRRRRRRARDEVPPPNQLGHYTPIWKDCLEAAKVECRAVHALSDPWPKLQANLENSIMDSLTTVVMEKNQRGIRFEPGLYQLSPTTGTDISLQIIGRTKRFTWQRWYVVCHVSVRHPP